MYRHIVMFWLRHAREQSMDRATALLRTLCQQAEGLVDFSIDQNTLAHEDACALCLHMTFTTTKGCNVFFAQMQEPGPASALSEHFTRIVPAGFPGPRPPGAMPRLYSFAGPGNRDKETLGRMLDAGMSGIRLSFLHTSPDENEAIAQAFREAAEKREQPVEILLDDVPPSQTSQYVKRFAATGLIISSRVGAGGLRVLRDGLGPAVRIYYLLEHPAHISDIPACAPYFDELIIPRDRLARNLPRREQLPASVTLPTVEQQAIAAARLHGKPFMIGYDLLASMYRSLDPTLAEINDVHHAIQEGAASLMLATEGSQGLYPVEAMAMLRSICEAACGQ